MLPTKPPSKPRTMPFSVPQQDHTTLSPGLGPDLVGIHSISLAARYRVAASSSALRRGLEKVSASTIALFCLLYLPLGNMTFFFLPWPPTQRMHLTLFRFTLQNMITPAALDAQVNLTLSLITMSVPGCKTSFYLSGDMLRYCHREIIFYMT